jgi:hypothetical protein
VFANTGEAAQIKIRVIIYFTHSSVSFISTVIID